MVEAKQTDEWNHTAATLAMQYNTAFGKKRQSRGPEAFHPFGKYKPKKRLSREESRERLNAVMGVKRKHGHVGTSTEGGEGSHRVVDADQAG